MIPTLSDFGRATPSNTGRRAGAIAGFVVALLYVISGGLMFVGLLEVAAKDFVGALAAPTLATGAITGWVFGPRGLRQMRTIDRGRMSLAMAVLATAVGDYLVALAISTANADMGNPLTVFLQGAASALVIWPFGLLFFG